MRRAFRSIAAGVLACALLCPSMAGAWGLEEKNIVSGKVSLKPEKGYIYLEAAGRFAGIFVRVPDEEDIADYRVARDKAFDDEIKRYERLHLRWESDVALAMQTKQKTPEEPVAPTKDNFSFDAIETHTAVAFGPDFVFSKDSENGRYAYLNPVKPGTYIWYGPVVFDSEQGYIGLCYCMGSVRFEVRPGEITDLGNFLVAGPRFQDQPSAPMPPIRYNGGLNGYRIELPEGSKPVTHGLPASLAGYPVTVPELRAAGKMNNFYGVVVGRLAPVDGVLAYRRDAVVDVRTGEVLRENVVPQ